MKQTPKWRVVKRANQLGVRSVSITADTRPIADERRVYLAALASLATARGWALEAVATEPA